MTNYVWKIIALETTGESNVVTVAQWALEIKEDITSLASLRGTSKFDNTISNKGIVPISVPAYPNPSTFIEFSSLKESDVINWIENELGDSVLRNMRSQLKSQVEKQSQINVSNLPWA
jgi:hypothetical protein